jgi:hypothetical protein
MGTFFPRYSRVLVISIFSIKKINLSILACLKILKVVVKKEFSLNQYWLNTVSTVLLD